MIGILRSRKLIKYLREHPYLLDDAYSMSMSEAQRLIDESAHVKTFDEMFYGVLEKVDISEQEKTRWKKWIVTKNRKKRLKKIILMSLSILAAAVLMLLIWLRR